MSQQLEQMTVEDFVSYIRPWIAAELPTDEDKVRFTIEDVRAWITVRDLQAAAARPGGSTIMSTREQQLEQLVKFLQKFLYDVAGIVSEEAEDGSWYLIEEYDDEIDMFCHYPDELQPIFKELARRDIDQALADGTIEVL